MKQKTLSGWLKGILVITGICGLVVYLWIIPEIADALLQRAPEFESAFLPWLIFLILTGIPCYAALGLLWKIAQIIGANRSFCMQNAKLLKYISVLAAADAGFFFAGNIVLLLLDWNHPGIVLVSLCIVFIGVALSAAAALLSYLIQKAADLQEQSDLTI